MWLVGWLVIVALVRSGVGVRYWCCLSGEYDTCTWLRVGLVVLLLFLGRFVLSTLSISLCLFGLVVWFGLVGLGWVGSVLSYIASVFRVVRPCVIIAVGALLQCCLFIEKISINVHCANHRVLDMQDSQVKRKSALRSIDVRNQVKQSEWIIKVAQLCSTMQTMMLSISQVLPRFSESLQKNDENDSNMGMVCWLVVW